MDAWTRRQAAARCLRWAWQCYGHDVEEAHIMAAHCRGGYGAPAQPTAARVHGISIQVLPGNGYRIYNKEAFDTGGAFEEAVPGAHF